MNTFDFKGTKTKKRYMSGAERSDPTGKGRFDLISPFALKRLAKVYEKGAIARGDRNWEKGMPYSRLIDSALRHINQYAAGEGDEDHIAHAAWNLFAILHFDSLQKIKLDDRPHYNRRTPHE